VAEHHRNRSRAGAVDDGQIRMTETCGLDPNEQLAYGRRVQLEFLDLDRT
jgi:hypothetical protein